MKLNNSEMMLWPGGHLLSCEPQVASKKAAVYFPNKWCPLHSSPTPFPSRNYCIINIKVALRSVWRLLLQHRSLLICCSASWRVNGKPLLKLAALCTSCQDHRCVLGGGGGVGVAACRVGLDGLTSNSATVAVFTQILSMPPTPTRGDQLLQM